MGNMHVICQELKEDAESKIKYPFMIVVKDNKEFHYVCKIARWNWWLNRYYPQAELILVVEHIK